MLKQDFSASPSCGKQHNNLLFVLFETTSKDRECLARVIPAEAIVVSFGVSFGIKSAPSQSDQFPQFECSVFYSDTILDVRDMITANAAERQIIVSQITDKRNKQNKLLFAIHTAPYCASPEASNEELVNEERLALALVSYRNDFYKRKSELKNKTHWEDEQYKWIAVKHFQDYWNIDAANFAAMFKEATAKHDNLLNAQNFFPRGMILDFAAVDSEAVRQMFRDLFDESKSVVDRINDFIDAAERLRSTYGSQKWKSHYQNLNSISTYLWSMFPNKYYIYKYSECKRVAVTLESDFKVQKGAKADTYVDFIRFYDEIADYLAGDGKTKAMMEAALNPDCYPDPEYRTLTIDVGFYISRYYSQSTQDGSKAKNVVPDDSNPGLSSEDWFPALDEYSPGFTKGQWLDLLANKEIIGPVWGGVLAAFYEIGGAATCTQIAKKYNKSASAISGNCTQLAKRIYKETQCPLSVRDDGNNRYWPILFQGKNAGPDVEGDYIWKLRPDLYDALTEFDIMRYQWKNGKNALENGEDCHYWWLNANPLTIRL